MQTGALAPYEHALVSRAPLALVTENGRRVDLEVDRWLAGTDRADDTVLARSHGSVLDVGCGPGRFVRSLARRGGDVLGIDIADAAVSIARRKGLPVIRRSVFDELPDECTWDTVLLLDGNVGIGGDPVALLRRTAEIVAPGGLVIVEAQAEHRVSEEVSVRFIDHDAAVGPAFGWAFVGMSALRRAARTADYVVADSWSCDGRRFAALASSSNRTR